MPRRNDVDVLARTTTALLQPRDPVELARAVVDELTRGLDVDGGFLFLDRAGGRPVRAAAGLEPDAAHAAARELHRRLRRDSRSSNAWPAADAPMRLGARPVLAATLTPSTDAPGILAVFGGPGFDAARHTRLLEIVARHSRTALRTAAARARARRKAERLAIRAEQAERVRQGLERHSREIERSLAQRSRFFAAMSHELRTPINAILGYSQLLRDGVVGPVSARQRDTVDKVAGVANQLLDLVNDVLDLARIEAGRLPVRQQPVELPSVVNEAAQAIEVQARCKGLELRVEPAGQLPPVRTDATRVRQILLNLLSNAVKFTSDGSVTIRTAHLLADAASPERPPCSPGADGWVAIAVEDTGIGIPPAELQTIFDAFVQVPSSPAADDGTGLGLAISHRLARMLGGHLTVESTVGERSVFTLFLPCPARPAETASAA